MPSNSIKISLSAARIATYETTVGGTPGVVRTEKALSLYMWNAHVSAALLMPLHVCEVTLRNAISDVLERVYGPLWPWSVGFERSLPAPAAGYKPRDDLIMARRYQHTTGKVIPELKFVFWQKMLTSRFDSRLWNNHISTAFPNAALSGLTPNRLRQKLYDDLETLRKLRNRIAHHEPIISRNLQDDFDIIAQVISFRCEHTMQWMLNHQTLLSLLTIRPL
nr:hypothetical protein [uncultured Enterobacter sp.]